MSELTVETKNNRLVVDSRLIAEELGIEHRTLRNTITKYSENLIELGTLDTQATAVGLSTGLLKETSPKQQDGTGGEIYYLLTEAQANFVMSLSQNTIQVVEAKMKLVKAFSKAKQALQSINPELLKLFNDMTEKMNILAARTQKLDEIDKATNNNKGIKGVIETEIEDIYPEDLEFTTREYLEYKAVGLVHLNTMRRRAIGFYRQGIQSEELPKKGSEVVFKGNSIAYLDQALKTTLELD